MSDRDDTNIYRLLFRLQTSADIFKCMEPEDKDEFFEFLQDKLNLKNEKINSLMSGMTGLISKKSYGGRSVGGLSRRSTLDDLINSDGVKGLLKATLRQMKEEPYRRYAVLKIPKLFQKFKALESTLGQIEMEDVVEFVKGNPDNKDQFILFSDFYLRKKGRCKELLRVLSFLDKATVN